MRILSFLIISCIAFRRNEEKKAARGGYQWKMNKNAKKEQKFLLARKGVFLLIFIIL
jgi:hypothetical protein